MRLSITLFGTLLIVFSLARCAEVSVLPVDLQNVALRNLLLLVRDLTCFFSHTLLLLLDGLDQRVSLRQ